MDTKFDLFMYMGDSISFKKHPEHDTVFIKVNDIVVGRLTSEEVFKALDILIK